jgi:hypothetical protein
MAVYSIKPVGQPWPRPKPGLPWKADTFFGQLNSLEQG